MHKKIIEISWWKSDKETNPTIPRDRQLSKILFQKFPWRKMLKKDPPSLEGSSKKSSPEA